MAATRQRLGAAWPARSERDPLLARVVGALFVLGAALMTIALLLPHPVGSDDGLLRAIAGLAFGVGAALLAAAQRTPPPVSGAAVAGFSVMVCGAIHFSGVAAGLYSTMFVWAVLVSAYFFSPAVAAAQLAWLLAWLAAVLSTVDHAGGFSPLTRWLLTAFALAVAGAVTAWLVARGKATEDRAERFFWLTRDMLCTASPEGHFVETNPAWSDLLGYSPAELRALPFLDLVHPDDRKRTIAQAERVFGGEDAVYFQNRYRAKDGTWRWLDWSATFSPAHGLVYARATDVTAHKRLESEREALVETLRTQARRDELTKLPNRRWLAEELQREVARAGRQGFSLYLTMLDLDRFKQYNDRHGHPAGDALLRESAHRWIAALRASDFMARYGGEEFVVVLPDCSTADARVVIERVRAATPFDQTCSAGIAVWEPGESAEQLIARADAALYAAKGAGRDRTVIVDSGQGLRLAGPSA